MRTVTSIFFDTSFLLNNSPDVERIIKLLRKDKITSYISSTVQSELDYLYQMGRISRQQYSRAVARYKKAGARSIDRMRNYLQESMTRECALSMNREHGTEPEDVRNDCTILSSSLNNSIDLIMSEDFHFTSKYTDRVVETICNTTCARFHKLCECDILLLNKDTFLAAYRQHQVDLDVVDAMKKEIRKDAKVLEGSSGTR